MDSWIWSASCPESRTSVVTSLGQSLAASSSTASVPTRSASATRPSGGMCSQPAAAMCPRNEFGKERRCISPSPMAVASIPPPVCTTVWSMSAPSLDPNTVCRR